jgi:hypothetical protein
MSKKKASMSPKTLHDLTKQFSNLLNKVAEEESNQPPNYRPAEDPTVSCNTCAHFEGISKMCRKYVTQVDPKYVCDSYKKEGVSKTRVPELTPENADTFLSKISSAETDQLHSENLLEKLSALLSQAQVGMPPPPPPGAGGMPPPPPGAGGMPPMDLGMMLGGMGGMGGMPPMGGAPAPGGLPPDVGAGIPPLPPEPPPSEQVQVPEKETAEEGGKKEKTEEEGKIATLLEEILKVLRELSDKLGGSTVKSISELEEKQPKEKHENKPPVAEASPSQVEQKMASFSEEEEAKIIAKLLELL